MAADPVTNHAASFKTANVKAAITARRVAACAQESEVARFCSEVGAVVMAAGIPRSGAIGEAHFFDVNWVLILMTNIANENH